MLRFEYDTVRYDFRTELCGLLGVDDLERLHEAPAPRPGLTLAQRNGLMVKVLYDRRSARLDPLFHAFVNGVLEPLVGPIVSFQARACLRVHMPGMASISAFHRDRDWGQLDDVQNVWLPFTPVSGNNALWVESAPGRGDHAPISLDYGEGVIFAGAVLEHGSVPNDTSVTRVSADFRVMSGAR